MKERSTATLGGPLFSGSGGQVVMKGRYSTYLLHDILGKGGSAVVYRATDKATGQEVAVKRITTHDAGAMQQWRTEVETLMALREDEDGSSHVIRYLDHMHEAETIILVEEYAPGGSLQTQLCAQGRGLEERAVARLMHQITSGLAYIHGKGIVHRDLKCANALVCGDGRVKLSDFGLSAMNPAHIAAAVAAAASEAGAGPGPAVEHAGPGSGSGEEHALMGSVYWMAPETVQGKKNSFSSDIWSLGCLCVELLTGKPPLYERAPANALYLIAESTEPPPLPDVPLSEDGRRFLRACLAHDPSQRPTAAQLLNSPWFTDARVQRRLDALLAQAGGGGDPTAVASARGRGGSPPAPDDVGQWVESCLFTDSREGYAAWVREGSLQRVVMALEFLTPAEAHGTMRSFAYAADRWGAAFVDPLGSTPLWDYGGMSLTSEMPQLTATLFTACCASQDPGVAAFAPAHPKAIRFLLSCRAGNVGPPCAEAMGHLYCGTGRPGVGAGAEGGGEESSQRLTSARERRRLTALHRLIADGGLLAIRAYLEGAGAEALRRNETPSVGWRGMDRLFAVLLAALDVGGAEGLLMGGGGSSSQAPPSTQGPGEDGVISDPGPSVYAAGVDAAPTLRWYLAVQEAARRELAAAAVMLVRLVQHLTSEAEQQQQQQHSSGSKETMSPLVLPRPRRQSLQPDSSSDEESGEGADAADSQVESPHGGEEGEGGSPSFLTAAGAGLAATLVMLASRTTLPEATRLCALQCLPPLRQHSPRAAHVLAHEHCAVPLYAHVLRRIPAPAHGGCAGTLHVLLELWEDTRIRTNCAASPLVAHALAELLVERASDLADDSPRRVLEVGLCLRLVRGLCSHAAMREALAYELADAPLAVRALRAMAADPSAPPDFVEDCMDVVRVVAELEGGSSQAMTPRVISGSTEVVVGDVDRSAAEPSQA